jgi:hypothetical protein
MKGAVCQPATIVLANSEIEAPPVMVACVIHIEALGSGINTALGI